jgi:hypothetical protein
VSANVDSSARGGGEKVSTLLALLLLCGAILAGYSAMRLFDARESAAHARGDLRTCRADLSDLEKWRSGRTTGVPLTAQDPELNRRLSAAAVAARISGELSSIEPGTPARVKDADYTETKVFVRLGAVTLPELVKFLQDLSAADSAVKTKSIELQTPDVPASPPQRAGEMWTCDLTLAYLAYAPRGPEGR